MSMRPKHAILSVTFVLHAAITLWCVLHHEAWRDEAHLWLLMRDAPIDQMLHIASNGGEPLLFHLAVRPFARAGVPFVAMQLLNLACVWGAVLLLFRSRAFPALVKVLFAFSYFPAFEFAVIPRPYGLQMLLTFAMAATWRERDSRPMRLALMVALLANTTTLGLLTAAVAGASLLGERLRAHALKQRRIVASTIVMIAGGLHAVAQLWPRPGRQEVYTLVSLDTVWYALASTFFPEGRVETFIIPAVLILGIVTYGISRTVLPVLLLWTTGTAMILVYVFIWMGGIRHAGLLLILVIASVWIADAYGPYRRERLVMAALAVAFAYSIVPAYHAWVAETKYAFSGSREVATFLQESGIAGEAVIVSHMMFWTSPLVYLPGVEICYPASGRCGTHALWERRSYELSKVPLPTVLDRARRQFGNRRWIFLSNRKLPGEDAAGYRLLFETSEPIWRMRGEYYYVYEPTTAR